MGRKKSTFSGFSLVSAERGPNLSTQKCRIRSCGETLRASKLLKSQQGHAMCFSATVSALETLPFGEVSAGHLAKKVPPPLPDPCRNRQRCAHFTQATRACAAPDTGFRQSRPHFDGARISDATRRMLWSANPTPTSLDSWSLGSLEDALVMVGHRAWAWGLRWHNFVLLVTAFHPKFQAQPRRQAARIQQLREDLPGTQHAQRTHTDTKPEHPEPNPALQSPPKPLNLETLILGSPKLRARLSAEPATQSKQ